MAEGNTELYRNGKGQTDSMLSKSFGTHVRLQLGPKRALPDLASCVDKVAERKEAIRI